MKDSTSDSTSFFKSELKGMVSDVLMATLRNQNQNK